MVPNKYAVVMMPLRRAKQLTEILAANTYMCVCATWPSSVLNIGFVEQSVDWWLCGSTKLAHALVTCSNLASAKSADCI